MYAFSVLSEVVIVSKALSQLPVPFTKTIGFAVSVVSSPKASGGCGASSGLASGLVSGLAGEGAGEGAGLCAKANVQTGHGPAPATVASAKVAQSATRRNIRFPMYGY